MSGQNNDRSNSRRLASVLLVAILLPAFVVGAALGIAAMTGNNPFATPSPTTPSATPAPSPAATRLPIRPPVVTVHTPVAHPAFVPLIANAYTAPLDCDDAPAGPMITSDPAQWQPLTLGLSGPPANASDARTNPFLDYRLQVTFLGPSKQIYIVPGYFAGDGPGDGAGAVWQAHFAADEPGAWRYCVSFRQGANIAVDLNPYAGEALAPDGAGGEFQVSAPAPGAPDFFKWGRLEYVGGHYLKFRDGPYWLKGGTNSPENFLGYSGFENTVDQGGPLTDFLHSYAPHIMDGRPDDPSLHPGHEPEDSSTAAAEGILGALNYLSDQHVNSIYFLTMNLGGDGQDTYPYLSADDNTRFDVAKLDQWGIVLEHAQQRGIALHIVLNEVEEDNRLRLDNGQLGVERRLFYREMVARFAHLPAIKWNLSEEVAFSAEQLREFADYLNALDWADHPIVVHNSAGMIDAVYGGLLGDHRFSGTSMQYSAEEAGGIVEAWRQKSTEAGRPWFIDMDENNPAGIGLTPDNAGDLRKQVLYDVYFSGAAGLEWYLGYHELPLGGDINLEDFRTRERMWNYMWYARRFMEENLPFHLMSPADDLLEGESPNYGGGEVLALPGQVYAVYLPTAAPSGVLNVPPESYKLQWYDPRTGAFTGDPVIIPATEAGLPLGAPPSMPEGDWVVLITREGGPMTWPTDMPHPYP